MMNLLITLIFVIAVLSVSGYGLWKSNSLLMRKHWALLCVLELVLLYLCIFDWPCNLLGPQETGDTIFAFLSTALCLEGLLNFKRYTVLR